MSMADVLFTSGLKEDFPNLKIILCIHNPVLNQIVNYPYLKEFFLRKHHLSFLFNLLSCPKLEPIYKRAGIMIRRKQYSSILTQNGDKIVMLSPGHMQELIDVIGEDNADKVIFIPNCIDLSGNYNNISKENMILWVGAVGTSIKRIDYMLEIWKLFSKKDSSWNLYILGEGSGLGWAKDYAQKNNLKNIFFTGRCNPEEYYKRAKISCVTSSYESFSMVVLESLKYGVVPIVNNSFPSASYLVKDGVNGFLPKKFDKSEFLNALQKVTSSDDLWKAMSKNSIKSARKFSTDNVGREWLKLFDEL